MTTEPTDTEKASEGGTAKNTTQDAGSSRGGCPRWVKVALVLSLGLNLLVAGAIVGGALRHARMPSGGPVEDVRRLGIAPFVRALEPRHQRALRDEVLRRRSDVVAGARGIRRASQRFVAALRAEPYDPDAASAALADVRARVLHLQEIGHAALLAQLERMDAAERAALADRLEKTLRRLSRQRRSP